MARVNVEQQALTDSRLRVLGELLGGDHRLALGHMVYIWNECQERNIYSLLEREIQSLAGRDDFASALVESGLGERLEDGRIRIRGTKGRIEWLNTARKNGKKGGRPKSPSARHAKREDLSGEPF